MQLTICKACWPNLLIEVLVLSQRTHQNNFQYEGSQNVNYGGPSTVRGHQLSAARFWLNNSPAE